MENSKNVRGKIERLASERIIVLDGAMGSMIWAKPLEEEDFRGERFREHPRPLKRCNDLLCLTMPDLISDIHKAYLEAGADIITTCSFNATSVSLADYGLADCAYEISAASARLARKAVDDFGAGGTRFVAGSMGPLPKSASMPADINDPGKRAIAWDELEAAYYDNARGLLDGGVDLFMIETIFDTLNAKAAIFAVKRLAEERGTDLPMIISATVGNGGRLLTGQTVEAFCVSVLHADPIAVGLNCSFGAEKMKPFIASVSASAPCLVSAYPNAGLPNREGKYDETPGLMAAHIEEFFREGLVNLAGGCCGSTPEHIAAITAKAKNYAPRPLPALPKKNLLAGLVVREIDLPASLDAAKAPDVARLAENSGFLDCINRGEYEEAAEIACEMLDKTPDDGAALIDLCLDGAAPANGVSLPQAMTNFLNYALQFPNFARLPVMLSGARWDVIEAGLKCLSGKGIVVISKTQGEAESQRQAKLAQTYGAAVEVIP